MKKQQGFTTLELLTAIIVLIVAGIIFLVQKNDISAVHRDTDRKIAINAIYANLESIVYPTLKGYPAKLDTKQLKAMDESLFYDTNGIIIGDAGSQYRYEPSNCAGDICQSYKLFAKLEKEAEFMKASKH